MDQQLGTARADAGLPGGRRSPTMNLGKLSPVGWVSSRGEEAADRGHDQPPLWGFPPHHARGPRWGCVPVTPPSSATMVAAQGAPTAARASYKKLQLVRRVGGPPSEDGPPAPSPAPPAISPSSRMPSPASAQPGGLRQPRGGQASALARSSPASSTDGHSATVRACAVCSFFRG